MKSTFSHSLRLLAATCLLVSTNGYAQSIIDVTFPDGTGINPTFLEIDNDVGGGTSTWTQSSGVLSGNNTANSTVAAASETTIDFTTLGEQSLVLNIDVSSVTGTLIANGMFFGFQQRNNGGDATDLWNSAAPSFGLVIPGNATHLGGGGGAALVLRRVAVGGSDPSGPGRYQFLPDFGIATSASIADGFNITLTVNSAGWEVAITGLEDLTATAITGGSGTWGVGGINDWAEFNDQMRVGVSYQTAATGGDLTLSKITLQGGTAGNDFRILSAVYDPDSANPAVTLIWKSGQSPTYGVDYSLDLSNWIEINDSVPTGGETTEMIHQFLPDYADLVGADRIYYRVRPGDQ